MITLSTRAHDRAVYCIPAAGMLEASFQGLAESLDGAAVKVITRRGPSDGVLATVADLARSHLDALRADQPAGPYVLVGHSFGASVAFEMARQLETAGHDVSLYMLDGPFYLPRGEMNDQARRPYLQYFLNDASLVALLSGSEGRDRQEVYPEMVTAIHGALALRAHGSPDAGNRTLEDIARTYAADLLMSRDYVPSGIYAGRVRVLVAADGVLAGENLPRTQALYARWFPRPVEVGSLPGGHLSMLHRDNVYPLAAELVTAARSYAGT